MMVTFISQCEKKALSKTRRVLDSFANRIGSRTWQTVITNEGLNAVKSALRQTASKNTAVSCHWLRSRSRSELVWVVGATDKFNQQGIVPVNYTNQKDVLKIDGIEMNIKTYFANTKKQALDQHLFAVGYLAQQIIKTLIPTDDVDKWAQAVFVAGCLHDIGKIDPAFQKWIADKAKEQPQENREDEGQHIDKTGKFSFETHPRHNEISLLMYYLMDDEAYKGISKPYKKQIQHVLYWHHAKPIRKEEFKNVDIIYQKIKKNVGASEFSLFIESFKQLIKAVNQISSEYFSENELLIGGILSEPDEDHIDDLDARLPGYKIYSEGNDDIGYYQNKIINNAKNNLARMAVVTGDRLVSSLSSEALNSYIEEGRLDSLLEMALLEERGLKGDLQACLDGFKQRFPDSERNKLQHQAALSLSESETRVSAVKVLNGPAGCGKTKIALEWAAQGNARKIIWVCPRVHVCQGLVKDLTSTDYLPDTKIEIYTGEFKNIYQSGQIIDTPEGEEFSGDIVLTTIDQIINTITTHTQVTGLVQYMNAHVVFDEYHEYINMPAFNLLFAELVECKKLQEEKARALLVSATPNYFFVEELLNIDREDIIGIDSFNKCPYKVQFKNFDESKEDEDNPLYQSPPKSSFIISNTAIAAQKSFIKQQCNENGILIHSKFTKSDKQELFDKVFNCFKQDGNKAFDVLRAGPIVQASLNITCDHMVTEFTSPENWLQRLGRLDRFGQNKEQNIYITAVPKSIADTGKQTGGCARFLSSLNCFQSAKAWYRFLLSKEIEGRLVTLSEIYQLYQEFYDDESCKKAVEQDLIAALKKSVRVLNNKVIDPISFPKRKATKVGKVKIKKVSLRGDNRFVQMALCKVKAQNDIKYLNQYAYDASAELDANLTAPVEQICGYGDSKQDLLSFMVKKHHNIKKTTKSYKDILTLNEARNPETPVYLSYIPEDLNQVASDPHPHAIYYALGDTQPIGAISIQKLQGKKV